MSAQAPAIERAAAIAKPILFGGEMVRAIMAGRKTQTRRLVTLPKRRSIKGESMEWVKSIHQDGGGNWVAWSTDATGTAEFTKKAYPNGEGFPCPYGKPGGLLWVRESFRVTDAFESVYYRADDPDPDGDNWRPSIHMPRRLARLYLTLEAVRIERLREISESDAVAEGVTIPPHRQGTVRLNGGAPVIRSMFRDEFITLWDSINGKRAPWADNPWVWVLTFSKA